MKFSPSKQIIAVVLVATMILTGCTAAWIQTALADLPVLVTIATNILTLISLGKGQIPSQQEVYAIQNISNIAKQGLLAIQALYDGYKAGKNTVEDIQNAITDLNGNLAQLLTAAQIKNPDLQAKVVAAVGIITGTLETFLTLLPQTQPKMSRKAARAVASQMPTPSDLRKQWTSKVGVPLVETK